MAHRGLAETEALSGARDISLLHDGVDVVTVAKLGGWKNAAQVLKTYGHAIENRKLTDVLIDEICAPVTQTASNDVARPRKPRAI